MSSPALPLDRAALSAVFKDPRTLLAFESLLQQAGSAGAFTTTGQIISFGGSAAPSGWLICDGSEVSRSQYVALFSVVDTTWGAGDGSTTFNLPPLTGRTLLGADGVSINVGDLGGAAEITLTIGQLPSHDHGVTDPQHTHPFVGDPHAHAITDPSHAHGINDPSHAHGAAAVSAATALNGAVVGSAVGGATAAAVTGITVNAAATGVTVNNATATGTNDPASTGVTVDPTGSGDPIPTQSPYAGVLYLIKT